MVQDPREILREVEQQIEAASFTTLVADHINWLGATIIDSAYDKAALHQWMVAVMDEEKDRTKAELSSAVEAVMFTPLGDVGAIAVTAGEAVGGGLGVWVSPINLKSKHG